MEKAVVVIKPDGVKRGLTGEILARFERAGLKIVAVKMIHPDRELVEKHYPYEREDFIRGMGEKTLKGYKDYGKDPIKTFGTADAMEIGKKINSWNAEFLTSGPVVAALLEGSHAVDNARNIAGATMPVNAPAGTVRGDFALDSPAYANEEGRAVKNLVHVSGSTEEAKYEEEIWFTEDEKFSYKRAGEE